MNLGDPLTIIRRSCEVLLLKRKSPHILLYTRDYDGNPNRVYVTDYGSWQLLKLFKNYDNRENKQFVNIIIYK